MSEPFQGERSVEGGYATAIFAGGWKHAQRWAIHTRKLDSESPPTSSPFPRGAFFGSQGAGQAEIHEILSPLGNSMDSRVRGHDGREDRANGGPTDAGWALSGQQCAFA